MQHSSDTLITGQMRKMIKARSWISSMQKFVYFENGVYSHYLPKSESGLKTTPIFNWDNAEQFTGLKDKNGINIYDGDILKIENTFYIYKVIFENCSFILYHQLGRWGELSRLLDRDMIDIFKNIEVIGNTHENQGDNG